MRGVAEPSSAARASRLPAVALATMLALVAVVIVMTLAGLGLLLPGWLSADPNASRPSVSASTVALAALPPEARQTLHLIEAGGPYPYRQDGAVFSNREGLLPRQPSGYYREYTVVTPGSP